MANDTSIARIASDPNLPVQRKRPNTESFDLCQLSFFDELLGIGQFDSKIPEPIDLARSPHPDDKAKDYNDPSVSDKVESHDDDSGQFEPLSVEQSIVATPLPQPLVVAAEKNSDAGDGSRELVAFNENAGQGQQSAKNVEAQKTNRAESEQNIAIRSADGVENVESVAEVPIPLQPNNLELDDVRVESENIENNVALQSNAEKASFLKPIQRSRRSSNETDSGAQDSGENEVKLALKQTHQASKGEGVIPVSKGFEEDKEPTNVDAVETQPRNKRAERLAKQASQPDPVSKEGAATPEANPLLDLNNATSDERPLDDSSLSVSSLPNTSSPIVSIPPIASSAFTLSGSGSRANGNSRSGVDGSLSNVTLAVRGIAPASNSSTTISGNGTSPARADQSRTEAVRYSAGTQISAYQEAKLVQRVLRGVEQLANGGGQVRLRLHPPELGSLQMSLRMEAGQVFAKLEVENTTARDALLNNVQVLKDRMAEQGMKVGAFEVEVSADSSGSGTGNSNLQSESGSGRESRWDNAISRFAQQNSNRLSSETPQPERELRGTWIRTNGSLDLTV